MEAERALSNFPRHTSPDLEQPVLAYAVTKHPLSVFLSGLKYGTGAGNSISAWCTTLKRAREQWWCNVRQVPASGAGLDLRHRERPLLPWGAINSE